MTSFAACFAGCFSPSFQNGDLRCAAGGACPPGYYCASTQTCWKNGDPAPGAVDLGEPPPTSSPAASVWISCGGGSGVGGTTGAELNLSIGGGVRGSSPAQSGTSVSFGFFGNDY
jgi:hypothetical protein